MLRSQAAADPQFDRRRVDAPRDSHNFQQRMAIGATEKLRVPPTCGFGRELFLGPLNGDTVLPFVKFIQRIGDLPEPGEPGKFLRCDRNRPDNNRGDV